MSLKRQAVLGVQWTGLSIAITTGLQLLQYTILAWFLEPQDFGLMAIVSMVIGFSRIFADGGISAVIIHRQDINRRQLSSLYWLNIGAGVIVYSLVMAITPLIVVLFTEPKVAQLIPYAGAVFVIDALGIQFQVLFQKTLRFNILARQEIAAALVSFITAVALVVTGYGVWGIIWAALAQSAARTILVAVPARKEWKPLWYFSCRDLRGFLSFGMYRMGAQSLNYLNFRADQILVGVLLNTEALGYYNFAVNLVVQPYGKINPIVTRVAFPLFAKLQHDNEKLRRSYMLMVRILTSINAPILIGLAAVAPTAIPLFFGEKWREAIPLIQLLSLYVMIRATVNPVGSMVLAKGRPDLGFRINLLLFIVIGPVLYTGEKFGGVVGIAGALLVLRMIFPIFDYYLMICPLIGSCAQLYFRAILEPMAIAAGMGVLIFGSASMLNIRPSLFGLTLQVLSGIILYTILLYFLNKETLKEIKALISVSPNLS